MGPLFNSLLVWDSLNLELLVLRSPNCNLACVHRRLLLWIHYGMISWCLLSMLATVTVVVVARVVQSCLGYYLGLLSVAAMVQSSHQPSQNTSEFIDQPGEC